MLNKKIKKLLIGTNNKGKLREIRDLLPKHIEILSIADLKLKSPKENGKTFQENSLILLISGNLRFNTNSHFWPPIIMLYPRASVAHTIRLDLKFLFVF